MINKIKEQDIALQNEGKMKIEDIIDINDLGFELTVVFHQGTTKFKGYYPEMNYDETRKLTEKDNYGYLTGAMLYPNWYFTAISLKFDIEDDKGKRLFEDILRMLPKTMMVKSGETGGVDFYYLTDSPALSTEHPLNVYDGIKPVVENLPSIEILGLNEEGKHNWILLPGSKTKSEYEIIDQGIWGGDYNREMTRLSLAELILKLDEVVAQFGLIQYFLPEA